MSDFAELIARIALITASLLAIVVIIQLFRAIFGGTWAIEEIILALVILNLTVTFGVGGYLISLNNKISTVKTKIIGHLEWHKGRDHKELKNYFSSPTS